MLLAAVAFAATCACAEIYRCRDAGAITYQEVPCPGDGGRATNIPTAFPDVNFAERDRLLRREAELDARMLRRAEIDAQVQIAREERLAREREAELQRQAANDTPLWIVPMAYRNPWRNVEHRRVITRQPQPRWP
jgi:hypothetical protein